MDEAPKNQGPLGRAAGLHPPDEERLLLKLKGRIIFLNVCDIDWIEASGNHVRFHVGEESHMVRMPLSRVSEKLDPSRFRQVHRSIIVNVSRIKELIRCNVSEFIVVLQNGKQLPCGRHYSGALKSLFKDSL
jgi:two-component system, LytTR family, response regulator